MTRPEVAAEEGTAPEVQKYTLSGDFRTWADAGRIRDTAIVVSPRVTALKNTAEGVVIPQQETQMETKSGRFDILLPSNSDPAWKPNGWSYIVRAKFQDGLRMAWEVSLDGDTNLADVAEIPYPGDGALPPVLPEPPVPQTLVESVQGMTGVVVLDPDDLGAAADDDVRLSDAREPLPHSGSHAETAEDPVSLSVAQVSGLGGTLNTLASGVQDAQGSAGQANAKAEQANAAVDALAATAVTGSPSAAEDSLVAWGTTPQEIKAAPIRVAGDAVEIGPRLVMRTAEGAASTLQVAGDQPGDFTLTLPMASGTLVVEDTLAALRDEIMDQVAQRYVAK